MSIDISVIMSVYNTEEKWLRQAAMSILGQTYRKFEFIIVLDSPTDDSEKIIDEYAGKDSRIIVIKNTENLGLTKSLNKGIKAARGKYIARMDSDDISLPDRLEKQFRYMEDLKHKDVAVLGGRVFSSDKRSLMQYEWCADEELFRIKMLFRNVGIPHPTAFIRKEILDLHSITYNEQDKKSQDYGLWTELMKYGRIVMMPDILLEYRVHEGQVSSRRLSQNTYAANVTARYAERYLGNLSNTGRDILAGLADQENTFEDTVKARKFLINLKRRNKRERWFIPGSLDEEIAFLWIRKAMKLAVNQREFAMLADRMSINIINPVIWKRFYSEKKVKDEYRKEIHRYIKKKMEI